MTKFEIQIGLGELIDRITILKIKKLNSLNVDIELNALEKSLLSFDGKYTHFFEKILFEINLKLWNIEENKRTKSSRYTNEYDNLSTLTTILNDLRYETKRKIDLFYNSEFKEQKSYKN
jgi:hypothetical protein